MDTQTHIVTPWAPEGAVSLNILTFEGGGGGITEAVQGGEKETETSQRQVQAGPRHQGEDEGRGEIIQSRPNLNQRTTGQMKKD